MPVVRTILAHVVRLGIRSRWLAAVCAAAVVLLIPAALHGQSCTTLRPPCPPDEPPLVSILPGTGLVTTNSSLQVTIYVSDDIDLDGGSWNVSVSGATGASFTLQLGANGTSGSSTDVIQLAPGSGNTVSATICDSEGQCDVASASYTYMAPPPPPEKATPTLSLAPHNGENRDAGHCVDCLDAMLGYAMPAYMSLDMSRTVALRYASAQAYPRGLVQVDAFDNSLTPPQQMSLRLLRADGSAVDLVTGGQEVFYSAGNGTTRLTAQFDARLLPTGAYDYTAVVRSWWGSESREDSIRARVLVVNERDSPFGWGWGMPGLQRLHLGRPDSAIVVTQGDGSIAFFALESCDGAGSCSYAAPAGDFSELVYLDSTERYTRRYPDGTTLTFGGDGHLRSVADRFGNATTFTFSGGLLMQIADPIGKTTTFGYGVNGAFGAPGKLAWIRDPGGRTVNLTYDASGNVTAIRDPDGVVADSVGYDGNHRLTAFWDRTGARTDVGYDVYGGVATNTAPEVVTTDVGTTRPVTSYQSLYVAALPGAGTGGSAGAPGARVIPDSVWLTTTTPRGEITRVRVNRFGSPLLIEQTDPAGALHVSRWTYNGAGQVQSTQTPTGGSTSYTWSGPDLVQIAEHAAGTTTALTYDPSFHQVEEVRLNGVLLMKRFLDASGLADSVRIDTSTTDYTHDSRGRLLTSTDPSGHRVTLVYESSGMQNTRTVTMPRGSGANGTTTYAYDAHGRVQSITEPGGRTTSAAYDDLNREVRVVGPIADTVLLGYDDPARTYTTTDPRGLVYTSTHNALGWQETRTDPLGGVEYFAYDRHGNLTSYTNRRGGVVSFTYDDLDRVITQTANTHTTTFAYDTALAWMAASNMHGTDTLFTDAAGRSSAAVTVRSGRRYVVRHTYNLRDEHNSVVLEGPWGADTIRYGYDDAGRLDWLRDLVTSRGTSIAYNADGLPSTVTLPTGTSYTTALEATTTYTAAHLPRQVAYSRADHDLGRRYRYDAVGRLSVIVSGTAHSDQPVRMRNEVERSASYDNGDRLTSYTDVRRWEEDGGVVCPDPMDLRSCYREAIPHSSTLRQATYAYDKAGNRTDRGAVYEPSSNRVASVDGYTLTYDADGNLESKVKAGVWNQTFTWDHLGQLTQVTTNGVTTTFAYDGWGRRVRKSSGGTTTSYLYDGDDLIAELDDAGNPVREYAYYPGTDRPHSVRRSSDGAIFYYVTALPGHVVALVDTARQVVNEYEYTPFGEPIAVSEQVPQPLRYTAREYDDATGLYHYRARYYDPHLGRFISEDPSGLAGGINPYAYVANNPLNYTDPSGLDLCYTLVNPSHAPHDGYGWHVHAWEIHCDDGGDGGYIFVPGHPSRGPSGLSFPSADRPTIGPGRGRSPLPRSQTTFGRELTKCSAAAADAGFAVVGDLLSLTGAGWVATRATRGAALTTKLARAGSFLLRDRVTGVLSPTGSGLHATNRWLGSTLATVGWTATNNAIQGEQFNFWKEAASLVPGINMGMKIYDAVQICF